ncbi:MAG: hypothetical protein HRT78_12645 [Halomonas sp.]|nr:hypothetical protein [Halomonas sp.]NQY77938.1 hypothetical protein [Halomonas sp.]
MDIDTHDFDTWFETLVELLADRGVMFADRDAVESDYEQGKDVHDVAGEIEEEYGDDE